MDVRYQQFLSYFRARHGYLPPPTYEEWLFNVSRTNPVIIPFYPVNNTDAKNSIKEETTTQHTTQSKRSNWTAAETEALVQAWKDNFLQLESMQKNDVWKKIVNIVCKHGEKTLKQCKDKLRNLKDLYKIAKDSNKKNRG